MRRRTPAPAVDASLTPPPTHNAPSRQLRVAATCLSPRKRKRTLEISSQFAQMFVGMQVKVFVAEF